MLTLGCSSGTVECLDYSFHNSKHFDNIEQDKNRFLCVGKLVDDHGSLVASSVLISPTRALTAGHVVVNGNPKFLVLNNETIEISGYELYPEFYPKCEGLSSKDDLAVLFLKTPSKNPPCRLPKTDHIERLSNLTVVGFSGGYKKASTPGSFLYYGELKEELGTIKFFSKESTVWFGDSGGGVFQDGTLVGIISSFLIVNEEIIDGSAVDVFDYLKWIDDNTNPCNPKKKDPQGGLFLEVVGLEQSLRRDPNQLGSLPEEDRGSKPIQ
jgi:hypothetical protein